MNKRKWALTARLKYGIEPEVIEGLLKAASDAEDWTIEYDENGASVYNIDRANKKASINIAKIQKKEQRYD